jgi:hypothetical protein
VRFRLTWIQRATPLLYMIGPVLLAVISDHPVLWLSLLAAFVVVGLLLSAWFGVTLTPEGAHVHNVRRRFVPWSAVQDVSVGDWGLGRAVSLREVDRSTRLRAPVTAFLQRDRRFEQKVEVIHEWWVAHRGRDWRPAPPPSYRIPPPGPPAR